MSEQEPQADIPPVITEPRAIDLKVTVHSVEGLNFLTELGSQQLGVSILFPSHMSDLMSPLHPPAPKVGFEYSENYSLMIHPHSTINALLANPLEFFIYISTPDMKKQTQVARFVFYFDQLLFHNSYQAAIEGKVLPEGQNVLSGDELKANIECTWSEPLFEPEVAAESMIVTFNISGINSPPLAMVNCSTQPNNFSTHIFTYSLFADMPDSQNIAIEEGKFNSTTADGSDALVAFNIIQKLFVQPDEMKKWQEAAENEQTISFYLKPELIGLLSPLGITQEQYAALYGIADVPLSHFAKPGRSHFQASIPLLRDFEYDERIHGAPLLSPTGFPPEPVSENNAKKKGPARKATPSARGGPTAKGGRPSATPTGKKPRALSAKDKKVLAQLQSVLNFDDTDYFKESTTTLKLEITLSRPIIPRPATPASTKSPEEIVKPLPKMHDERLADATDEFCRQLNIAIAKLKENYDNKEGYKEIKPLIIEQLKPSVVEIVKQVLLPKEQDKSQEKPKITQSFISELRNFLIMSLHKTINTKFDMAYPRAPPVPPEMTIENITHKIANQSYHNTDNLEILYLKRCELDPLNPQWPYELALYYNDKNSPESLKYFAQAISIDYNFTAAILGFCANLAKSGNREDCVVLLNMLDQRKPSDPTITVCLSILYQLIESSKCDEFMGKISAMSALLPRSPNLIAAASLLDVHDIFLSEIMLTREQLQCGRTKDLLILLARFTQQTGEFSRAQEYLREALEADREDLAVWKMLGEFQYAAGDFEKAKASFEQLLALAEEADPEVCFRLAIIYISHSKYEQAFDLLMFTVQKLEMSFAWTCLGVCCLRMGDFEEAEAALSEANFMDRWDATTWGYCAVMCGKTDRRIEGEQAICYAAKLNLRDFRLINEIFELFDDIAEGEETKACLNELHKVADSDCHKSLEPPNAGKPDQPPIQEEEEVVDDIPIE